MSRRLGSVKVIPVREQVVRLRVVYPSFQVRMRGNMLECVCELQPTRWSASYRVRIEYEIHRAPRIFVEEPALELRCGKSIPHRYRNESLCLYLPGSGEWTAGKYLANTIIPWIVLWLHYYEYWQATGIWFGGGTHEEPKEQD